VKSQISTKKQKCRIIDVLPAVGYFCTGFKQLCNWSQEQVPVAAYVIPLRPDSDSSYYRLATALEFVVRSQWSHLLLAVRSILTHPLPYSAYLCCSADWQGQSKARRFVGLVQCWAFVAFQLASYQLILSERNSATALARSLRVWLLGALNSIDLSHWMACIPVKQDGMVLKLCYN